MNRDERIVVVGAGLTGLRTAERLRELKFEGEIMILGDEKLPPYHRPALSKQLLMGTLRSSDLTLPAYEDLNAKWRFGTQVRQLVPHNKVLHLPGGEELTYDGLVIATGVEAKRPGGLPYYDPRVLVLRTMADGLDLERVIGSTKGRVAVVGGGFTGCEIAASLRHLSREVTLIGRQNTLLGNVLGPELGAWLTNLHRDHGVDLALGNSVQEWSPGPEGIGLRLTDGSTLLASCVIVAAGTVPLTGWLRGSGLPLDNGVVCEPTCHVVGAEDVVAAGDVAQWPNLRFDNVPRRVEHWLNAVEMGRAAAESLLAGRTEAEPFTPMPRFWTEQYGVRIQAAGMPKLGKDIITLGTPDEGTGTVYGYSKEGRLMGVVGLDCPSSVLAWTDSVSRQNPVPRPRTTPAEKTPAVSVGGQAKRGKGRHALPPKDKQPHRADKREHEIAYVEEPPRPVGVGTGPVPSGRPKNVVDSFSRMLPVKVRPGAGPMPPSNRGQVRGAPVLPPPPFSAQPNGRPALGPATGGRVMPPQFRAPNGMPEPLSGRLSPADALAIDVTGQMALLDANGHVRPPEFHDPVGETMVEGVIPPVGRGSDGSFAQLPPDPFGRPHAHGPQDSVGGMPPVRRGATDPRGVMPPARRGAVAPASFGSEGSPGGMPSVRRGVADSHGALAPGSRGPEGSFEGLAPARRGATDARGVAAPASFGSEGSSGGMPSARRGVADARSAMAPGSRGSEGSFESMPPARRGAVDSHGALAPASRDPEGSFGGMPPARRGAAESRGAMPPASLGPEGSSGGMPPARRGVADARGAVAPASLGSEGSSGGMPPARRGVADARGAVAPASLGPEGSLGAMPPARQGMADSRTMPPATLGPEDSFGGMPPARRDAADSRGAMPPARRGEDSFGGMPPARRGAADSRGAMRPAFREDPFGGVPAARCGPADSFDALPPARRPRSDRRGGARAGAAGFGRDDARGPEDPFTPLAAAVGDSLDRMPPVGGSADETTVDGMAPARRAAGGPTNGGRAARRRAEERLSRTLDPALSSMRLVPALPSMDDAFDRVPKHSRPDDDYLVHPRFGPEDSYDRMPAVDRPVRSSGGRRHA
ncbi:FAD-dependent oxidoreductase [Actinophytocola sp. NPDC049390]|uniref:FAD-dependent oxidoreductase n=1 Tax=Actinophytocola sp. NPDC049390 TaxID=3363894 RepID=UPI003792E5A2